MRVTSYVTGSVPFNNNYKKYYPTLVIHVIGKCESVHIAF